MKMFRLLSGMVAVAALGLAGCGAQSPDFIPKLLSINVTPSGTPPVVVAAGNTQQFTATGVCTVPPGSTDTNGNPITQAPCDPGTVNWSVDKPSLGTIDSNGLFTAGNTQGQVNVLAQAGDAPATSVPVTIGAPVVNSLVVTPASATIALGASQNFKVQGKYSDGQTRDLDPAAYTVTWSSGNTAVATVSPTSGTTTTASSHATGTTSINASAAPSGGGAPLTGSGTLTVNNAVLTGVAFVTPASDTVAVGMSKSFTLVGNYSDGTQAPIPNSQIDWVSSDPTIATVPATPDQTASSVPATGVAVGGPINITGTLKASVDPSITNRSASGQLTVVDAVCTTPMLEPTYSAIPANDPLCLVCGVDNPTFAIDADRTNFATMNSTIGLLGVLGNNLGNVSLTVQPTTPPGTQYPAGGNTGFVIGRPAGQLLSAEVLSQLTVTTLLGGVVQETSTNSASSTLPPLLRLTLLGQLGSSNTALAYITTTKPYDAIQLTFGTGVASLLTSVDVLSACATATPPPP